MTRDEVIRKIEDIKAATEPVATADIEAEPAIDAHESLFDVYVAIETEARSTGTPPDDGVFELIVRAAADLPARTMKGTLFKLAIWRWDAPGSNLSVSAFSRYEAVAYSAFKDLAAMLEEEKVLRSADTDDNAAIG
ncbi:MAG: hypothetical protein AAGH38_09215 [Pseudomonadota bacterium]